MLPFKVVLDTDSGISKNNKKHFNQSSFEIVNISKFFPLVIKTDMFFCYFEQNLKSVQKSNYVRRTEEHSNHLQLSKSVVVDFT